MIKSRIGRFSENFSGLIDKIKDIEKNKGNLACSDTVATEIIYQRILKAGGWKEN